MHSTQFPRAERGFLNLHGQQTERDVRKRRGLGLGAHEQPVGGSPGHGVLDNLVRLRAGEPQHGPVVRSGSVSGLRARDGRQ